MIDTLGAIADQCDGVRCDMAMLMMNDVFERTWGERAGARPADDYWPTVIGAVKARHPDFVFMAEAYWDLEYALQQQGFDYCYDKRLYDRLVHEGAESVRGHLTADTGYQQRARALPREPRRAARGGDVPAAGRRARPRSRRSTPDRRPARARGAARRAARSQLPVFLARRPDEEPDAELRAFYERSARRACATPSSARGEWQLGERSGWEGNDDVAEPRRLGLARRRRPRKLVVVNLGDAPAPRARLAAVGRPARHELAARRRARRGEVYERSGDDLRDGLYVALDPWAWNLFDLTPLNRKD